MRDRDDTARTEPGPRRPTLPEPAQLDPELVALRPPPQAQRVAALTIMAAAVVAVLSLLIALRSDVRYALSTGQPRDLSHVRAVEPSTLSSNTYVRITGTPTIGRAISFGRGLNTRYRIFPLAGQRNVYVQARDDAPEGFVRAEYSGRLVTFDELGGRYAEIARVMQRDAGLPVTGASFLLIADEPPVAYTWTLFVAALCLGFVLLDVYFIVRWFRPVKWAAVPATEKAL